MGGGEKYRMTFEGVLFGISSGAIFTLSMESCVCSIYLSGAQGTRKLTGNIRV